MCFFEYYKAELEKISEISNSQKDKILNFILKKSPYCKDFTIDILAFLENYELLADFNFSPEWKTKKILDNLLAVLADIAYIYKSGTRTGGVYSFAYNDRATAILRANMADTELINLHDKHDQDTDLITKLGEASLYGENVERLKADILAEEFAYRIMESEVNRNLSA